MTMRGWGQGFFEKSGQSERGLLANSTVAAIKGRFLPVLNRGDYSDGWGWELLSGTDGGMPTAEKAITYVCFEYSVEPRGFPQEWVPGFVTEGQVYRGNGKWFVEEFQLCFGPGMRKGMRGVGYGGFCGLLLLSQGVDRADQVFGENAVFIAEGGVDGLMPERFLERSDVAAVFYAVNSEGVTERHAGDWFWDTGYACGFSQDKLGRAGAQMSAGVASLENVVCCRAAGPPGFEDRYKFGR